MSPQRVPSAFRRLTKELRKLGYDVVPGGKHLKVIDPLGNFVYPMPSTPSDQRTVVNMRAALRQKGVAV